MIADSWQNFVWGFVFLFAMYGFKFCHQDWKKGYSVKTITITAVGYFGLLAVISLILWPLIGLPFQNG